MSDEDKIATLVVLAILAAVGYGAFLLLRWLWKYQAFWTFLGWLFTIITIALGVAIGRSL